MLYTFNDEGLKIWPNFSGQRAICDCCFNPLIAKCGDIVINHWAHLSGRDCDSWTEPMTEWHVLWQDIFVAEGADKEVRVKRKDQIHRADVMLENGIVVELPAVKGASRWCKKYHIITGGQSLDLVITIGPCSH